MSNEESTWLGCITFFGVILVAVVLYASNGIVVSLMWNWFFVEKFGLPQVGIAEAILIAIFVGFISSEYVYREMKDAWKWLLGAFMKPWIALSIFWFVMLFLK